jgi:hypothetical protein
MVDPHVLAKAGWAAVMPVRRRNPADRRFVYFRREVGNKK